MATAAGGFVEMLARTLELVPVLATALCGSAGNRPGDLPSQTPARGGDLIVLVGWLPVGDPVVRSSLASSQPPGRSLQVREFSGFMTTPTR